MNKEELKSKILEIIRNQCDGTYNDNIEDWNIASPEEAPKILFEKLSDLIDKQ